jgi:hypothetical protein
MWEALFCPQHGLIGCIWPFLMFGQEYLTLCQVFIMKKHDKISRREA